MQVHNGILLCVKLIDQKKKKFFRYYGYCRYCCIFGGAVKYTFYTGSKRCKKF